MKENKWTNWSIIILTGIGLFLGFILGIIGIAIGVIGGISAYLIHTSFFYFKLIKKEMLS